MPENYTRREFNRMLATAFIAVSTGQARLGDSPQELQNKPPITQPGPEGGVDRQQGRYDYLIGGFNVDLGVLREYGLDNNEVINSQAWDEIARTWRIDQDWDTDGLREELELFINNGVEGEVYPKITLNGQGWGVINFWTEGAVIHNGELLPEGSMIARVQKPNGEIEIVHFSPDEGETLAVIAFRLLSGETRGRVVSFEQTEDGLVSNRIGILDIDEDGKARGVLVAQEELGYEDKIRLNISGSLETDPDNERPSYLAKRIEIPLNDEETTNPTILAREYNPEVGGYVIEGEGNTIVYRETIKGDAMVVDSIETSFGKMLLEMPVYWQGVSQENQTQVRWTEKARANMEQGMREFYLVAYQQAYGVNRQESETMLDRDYPIPLTWVKDAHSWIRAGVLTETNSWTRHIRPSAGVSFLFLDEPYPFSEEYVKQHPRLVISFLHSRSESAYIYGFEVTREGRLVIVNYRGGEDSTNKTNQLNYGLIDALRAVGTDRSFEMAPVYHTDYRRVPDWSRDVMEKLGMGRYREEDYVGITDYEAFSLIRASR